MSEHERTGETPERVYEREVGGTGAGAAANETDRTGAEAATRARSGSAAPPPRPTPRPDDVQAETAAESEPDLGRARIPDEPAPGIMREPGPEAES